jgi:hypothetical protein
VSTTTTDTAQITMPPLTMRKESNLFSWHKINHHATKPMSPVISVEPFVAMYTFHLHGFEVLSTW